MLYLYFSAFVLLNVFVLFFRIVGWEEEEEGRGGGGELQAAEVKIKESLLEI